MTAPTAPTQNGTRLGRAVDDSTTYQSLALPAVRSMSCNAPAWPATRVVPRSLVCAATALDHVQTGNRPTGSVGGRGAPSSKSTWPSPRLTMATWVVLDS